MKNILMMTCGLLCTILVAVPAGAQVILRMQDNGKEIRVKAGEVIELALELQGGTGYLWQFQQFDEKHFQVVHTETKPLADRVGGPMLQVWRLKTLTPGHAKLTLDYLRPWEGLAKATQHFQVQVRIQ
jgi:predicted secreted protein